MNRGGAAYDIDADGKISPQPPQELVRVLGTCADWEAIEVEAVAHAPKKKAEAPKKAPARKGATKKRKS
tara:strand:- start:754 stop:960 length:207 start_codon:yes stop_codon:yes gene_type:complete